MDLPAAPESALDIDLDTAIPHAVRELRARTLRILMRWRDSPPQVATPLGGADNSPVEILA